jgi:hypothetical protein
MLRSTRKPTTVEETAAPGDSSFLPGGGSRPSRRSPLRPGPLLPSMAHDAQLPRGHLSPVRAACEFHDGRPHSPSVGCPLPSPSRRPLRPIQRTHRRRPHPPRTRVQRPAQIHRRWPSPSQPASAATSLAVGAAFLPHLPARHDSPSPPATLHPLLPLPTGQPTAPALCSPVIALSTSSLTVLMPSSASYLKLLSLPASNSHARSGIGPCPAAPALPHASLPHRHRWFSCCRGLPDRIYVGAAIPARSAATPLARSLSLWLDPSLSWLSRPDPPIPLLFCREHDHPDRRRCVRCHRPPWRGSSTTDRRTKQEGPEVAAALLLCRPADR